MVTALRPARPAPEDSLVTSPPYDQRLANEAAAADQCMKLGAVILKPWGQKVMGFTAPKPPSQSDQEAP
jgi:23S rRNA G2445 N2-methylase RlmL